MPRAMNIRFVPEECVHVEFTYSLPRGMTDRELDTTTTIFVDPEAHPRGDKSVP